MMAAAVAPQGPSARAVGNGGMLPPSPPASTVQGAMMGPLQSFCNSCHGLATATVLISGFPCGSAGKESARNAGDLGLIPGLGRSPGEGKGYPIQCSGLENSIDCVVRGVTKSQTRLRNFHFPFILLISDTNGL